MAERPHLFPSRTQQLSSLASKVLGGQLPGRIDHCGTFFARKLTAMCVWRALRLANRMFGHAQRSPKGYGAAVNERRHAVPERRHRVVSLKDHLLKTAEEDSGERESKTTRDWLKATSFKKTPMIYKRTERSFFIARKIAMAQGCWVSTVVRAQSVRMFVFRLL